MSAIEHRTSAIARADTVSSDMRVLRAGRPAIAAIGRDDFRHFAQKGAGPHS
jgi:hypothetical protein